MLAGLKGVAPDLDPFVFGHLGDGNLHILINRAAADVPPGMTAAIEEVLYAGIRELGGSFSAEHGVGSKRIHSLNATADPVKLAVMRQDQKQTGPGQYPQSRQAVFGRVMSGLFVAPDLIRGLCPIRKSTRADS